MDNLTGKQRKKNMQNIRSKNTLPECIIFRELNRKGIYFGKHAKKIGGRPDIVFRRKRLAVFIDSDFWHGRHGCYMLPKTNAKYWKNKIEGNRNRDKKITAILKKKGWKVMRIWEKDIKIDPNKSVRAILRILGRKNVARDM